MGGFVAQQKVNYFFIYNWIKCPKSQIFKEFITDSYKCNCCGGYHQKQKCNYEEHWSSTEKFRILCKEPKQT